jgi:hypothetical protein
LGGVFSPVLSCDRESCLSRDVGSSLLTGTGTSPSEGICSTLILSPNPHSPSSPSPPSSLPCGIDPLRAPGAAAAAPTGLSAAAGEASAEASKDAITSGSICFRHLSFLASFACRVSVLVGLVLLWRWSCSFVEEGIFNILPAHKAANCQGQGGVPNLPHLADLFLHGESRRRRRHAASNLRKI